MDLALNNLEWLICLKTKPNQTDKIPNIFSLMVKYFGFIKYSLNKLGEIILVNGIFPSHGKENLWNSLTKVNN